jgi:Zn-dependent protease with chaperone function
MTLALAAGVALGIGLPHLLDLTRAAPAAAAVVWLCSLALRALAGLVVVAYLMLYLPSTALFQAIAHWCWHAVLPLVAAHLGLDGHRVADAATAVPVVLLAASLISVGIGVFRAARSVHRLVRRYALRPGPRDSLIVAGEEVVLAAAGLRRPRVLVSAGALISLDDAELAAGLDHERGHIERRHRYVLLVAQMLFAVGRVVPGGRHALGELSFHLERDADRWSLSRRNDRFALARVIEKAAAGRIPAAGAALAPLAGAGVVERIRQILDEGSPLLQARRGTAVHVAGVFMVTLTVLMSGVLPVSVASGYDQLPAGAAVRHCAD